MAQQGRLLAELTPIDPQPVNVYRWHFGAVIQAAAEEVELKPNLSCATQLLQQLVFRTEELARRAPTQWAGFLAECDEGLVAEHATHGWLRRSAAQMSRELGQQFSRSACERALRFLCLSGFLDKRHNPDNDKDRTCQYRINLAALRSALEAKYAMPPRQSMLGPRAPEEHKVAPAEQQVASFGHLKEVPDHQEIPVIRPRGGGARDRTPLPAPPPPEPQTEPIEEAELSGFLGALMRKVGLGTLTKQAPAIASRILLHYEDSYTLRRHLEAKLTRLAVAYGSKPAKIAGMLMADADDLDGPRRRRRQMPKPEPVASILVEEPSRARQPETPPPVPQAWKRARATCQAKITDGYCKQVLAQLICRRCDEERVELEHPDEFALSWLEDHHRPTLEAALSEVLGRRPELWLGRPKRASSRPRHIELAQAACEGRALS